MFLSVFPLGEASLQYRSDVKSRLSWSSGGVPGESTFWLWWGGYELIICRPHTWRGKGLWSSILRRAFQGRQRS